MNKKILVPDEYIIDFSLTKEEREKKEKIYLKIIRKEQRKHYKNSYLREIIEIIAKLNSDEKNSLFIKKELTRYVCRFT